MALNLKAAFAFLGRNLGLTNPTLINWYSGGPTNSGESVNVDTAMRLETVSACVRLISGTIATLPCRFFQRDADGRGTMTLTHPIAKLLHDQPNADMTAVVFWEVMVACLLLWGNAYALIDRNGVGQIVAITPIYPERVGAPIRNPDGSIYYVVNVRGQTIDVPDSNMMHVKGFSLDGRVGLSTIALARETLGIAQAAEKTAASLFRNGLRSSAFFTREGFLDDVRRERFEQEYLPKFSGAINSGKMPVLEGGWDIKSLGMNPQDAQLLATRNFSIEQICRWFGVQPVMIGHMEKTTAWGTGLEQMNLWFLTYTLRTILRKIEQEISRSLLLPVEREKFYAEFNVDGLMRADSAGRAALLKVYAENGLRTRNEMRALDNEIGRAHV